MKDWYIFRGTNSPHDGIARLPEPPPWRRFTGKVDRERTLAAVETDPAYQRDYQRAKTYRISPGQDEDDRRELELVNAALYLRRPLLITGKPGTGKSSLAYAVAHELKLGPALKWPITSRSTVKDEGLYRYDAIGRIQEVQVHPDKVPRIGRFLRLGPLGTALLPSVRPRVLLIDEIDKSDVDFPNDLLNVFEEGEFEIPELQRLDKPEVDVRPHDGDDWATITRGRVRCQAFPFVVLTSNGERDFPPPFLRRCLRLQLKPPEKDKLTRIVEAYLDPRRWAEGQGEEQKPSPDESWVREQRGRQETLIQQFLDKGKKGKGDLATDQLLNAAYLSLSGLDVVGDGKAILEDALWKYLSGSDASS